MLLLLKAYAFGAPLLYVYTQFGGVSVVDVLAPVALLVAAARISATPQVFLFYIGYILVALVSLAVSTSSDIGASHWLRAARLMFIAAPFWMIYCLERFDEATMRELFRTVFAGLLLATVVGVVFHVFGIRVSEDQQRLWGLGAPVPNAYTAVSRAGGVAGNSTEYGTVSALFAMAVLSAWAFGMRIHPLKRIAYLVLTAIALVFSSSRVGLLMLVGFFTVFSLLQLRPMFRDAAVALVGPVIGVLAIVVFGTPDQLLFLERSLSRLDVLNLTGQGEFYESVRVEVWQMLQSVFFQIPLFGYGFKMSYGVFGLYIDNAFMLAWFELGPIGAAFFTMFWIVLPIQLLFRAVGRRHPAASAAFALSISVLLALVVTGPQSSPTTMPIIFMLLAMGLRRIAPARQVRRRPAAAPAVPLRRVEGAVGG